MRLQTQVDQPDTMAQDAVPRKGNQVPRTGQRLRLSGVGSQALSADLRTGPHRSQQTQAGRPQFGALVFLLCVFGVNRSGICRFD